MGFPEDGSLSVGSPIYVEGTNRLWELFQRKVSKGEQSEVDEISGSTGVNKGSGFDGLGSDK